MDKSLGKELIITIAGIGYVGLSNAILLAQHNKVYATDIQKERVEAVNKRHSPILDKEVEEYLTQKVLDLTATTNAPKPTATPTSSSSPPPPTTIRSKTTSTPPP